MKVEDVAIYLPFDIYDNVFYMIPSILGGICVNSGNLSEKKIKNTPLIPIIKLQLHAHI